MPDHFFDRLLRIPHPPGESLLLGSALALQRKEYHRLQRAWARQLGPIYAIRIGMTHVGAAPASFSKLQVSHGPVNILGMQVDDTYCHVAWQA